MKTQGRLIRISTTVELHGLDEVSVQSYRDKLDHMVYAQTSGMMAGLSRKWPGDETYDVRVNTRIEGAGNGKAAEVQDRLPMGGGDT